MQSYEYRVVPSPRKGKSGRGVKGGPAKLANALSEIMNDMGKEGWEYIRADTLPSEERQGLTSKAVKYHSMLVFRRAIAGATSGMQQDNLAAPVAAAATAAPMMASAPRAEPEELHSHSPDRVEPVLQRPEPELEPEDEPEHELELELETEQERERRWDQEDSPLAAALRGQNR